jgi:hypothetical protein
MSEKWGNLLNKLVSLTKSKKLSWNETKDRDEISTYLGDVTIGILFIEFTDGYKLSVRDQSGYEVDTFTDDELTETGYHSAAGTFATLFRTVKRQNSGADQALDKILERLNEIDDEIPF